MNIDEKYLEKLSPSLHNFTKVREGVYRFRCIYCGNGEKNPNKWKGYFYLKGNSYNYCCHKCNHRSSLKNIMKDLNPNLYKQYVEETSDDVFPSTVEFSPQHKKLTKK